MFAGMVEALPPCPQALGIQTVAHHSFCEELLEFGEKRILTAELQITV